MKRLQLLISGQVQGVGFRPQVYRIATALGLSGFVQNTSEGVLIEIQGESPSSFLPRLEDSLPELAIINKIQSRELPAFEDAQPFQIVDSSAGASKTIISPDTAVCKDCLNDLFDPKSRYYLYPFLNCTQCGPRFTVTRALPYDRAQTAMSVFPFCAACQREYLTPDNRRYHAQPTACADCGPELSATLDELAKALKAGKILALKGLGGYQLICDAANEATVLRLRKRKERKSKPFALMTLNAESAESFVSISRDEKNLLENTRRPIVLLKKKEASLAEGIAPGLSELGIMLPSTPLHYLLFHALAGYPEGLSWLNDQQPFVLIVTSANRSGNPLIIDDETANSELKYIADEIISYNRQILTRADDSVVKYIQQRPMFIRRARGFCPSPIQLPHAIPTTLALGSELKNTFCITRGDQAFVSQYLGNLTNKDTIAFFHESLSHWQRFLDVQIERLACDLHPDFYTSQLMASSELPSLRVQHHHAHLASVAVEHQLNRPVLGLALDGYGYGSDKGAWGGELLLLDLCEFERLGSLTPLPMQGGDRAAKQPWRMAAAVLHALGLNEQIPERFSKQHQATNLARLLNSTYDIELTSSCGRWFDAAAAMLGLCEHSNYEGQAAMLLESLVTKLKHPKDGWSFDEKHFNLLPVFKELLKTDAIEGANLFHGSLVYGLTEWLKLWSKKTAIDSIVLSGGCFINKVLTEGLVNELSRQGLKVYLAQQLPPNDGGLSLGQAWIAGNTPMEG